MVPSRFVGEVVDRQRVADAARTGFPACGITRDTDDPLSIALHGPIDHAAEHTRKVEAMAAALTAIDACPADRRDDGRFDAKRSSEMVDRGCRLSVTRLPRRA